MVGHRFKTSLQFKRRIEDINSATQSAAPNPSKPPARPPFQVIGVLRISFDSSDT